MEALIGELLKQGSIGLICIVLIFWVVSVTKDRDELRKQNVADKLEQTRINEAQQARYEALTNRVVTVIESNVKVITVFTEKIEEFTGTEKLRAEIADTRTELINELRERLKNAKSSGSRG